jgi:cytochrome c oxidase subunit 2
MADTAAPIDSAYMFVYWFSVVFTVGVTAAMLYFVFKYKRQKGVKSEPTGHFNKLEVFWTITPTIFIVFLFHASFTAYIRNATAAEGATEIRVRGKKWSWEFEYPSGDRVAQDLTLEVGRPYKMILSSEDVIHSFYIPEFRMKRDAVPGQYSFISFTPTVVGEAHVFCAEYCGTSHSGMLANIKILDHEEYQKFEKGLGKCQGTEDECKPENYGAKLFAANACTACHGAGGTGEIAPGVKSPAPRLVGIFGTPQPLESGDSVVADENYIRESIMRPNAKIVKGYTNVAMPAFVLKDDQYDALIAYIKSMK